MIIQGKHHFTHIPYDFGFEEPEQVTLEEYRYYLTPDGKKYPSITTCLGDEKKHIIENWRDRIGHEEAKKITDRASGRGTFVHEAIERMIANKDPAPVNPWVAHNLESVRPIIEKSLDRIMGIERMLYSDHLGVAGTSDCIGFWDGKPSIIDWKTSEKEKNKDVIDGYFKQGTFYSLALQEKTGIKADNIVIVIATDDIPEPQVFIENRKKWIHPLGKAIKAYVSKYPDRFDKGKLLS